MHHAHSCNLQSSTRLFWTATVLAACFLRLSAATPDDDAAVTRTIDEDAEDNNIQMGGLGVIKRGWDKNLQMWGKRGWGQLSGDWGKKKRSISTAWDDEDSLTIPVVQKRSWQRLHGGWGKRTVPSSDDNEIQDIASILDQQDNNNIHAEPESDYDFHVDEKRKWKQFSDGWGKRASNKWDNFRGSWGKRDPSWVNLKGMWGKRSGADYLSSE